MSEFDLYIEDFGKQKNIIRRQLNAMKGLSWEQKERTSNEATHNLNEASKCLSSMEKEIGRMEPSQRQMKQNKLKQCRMEFEALKKEFQKEQFDQNQQMPSNQNTSGRDLLVKNTNNLQKQGDKLENIHQIAMEAENTGVSTMNVLKQQREQIIRIDQKVTDTSQNAQKANVMLNQMTRRELCIKAGLCCAVFCLIIANCAALAIKLGK